MSAVVVTDAGPPPTAAPPVPNAGPTAPGASVPHRGAELVELPTGAVTSRRRLRVPPGIERLAGVVLLFAVWELAARQGWIARDILAGPSTVLTAGVDLARSGVLLDSLVVSLRRVAWGLGLGVAIGSMLAVVAGSSRVGDDVVDANVQMLRFVPIIALQPLFVVWLGVGETVKVAMIVLGVAFPVYVNTHAAIRSIDPRLRELSVTLGLTPREHLRRIVVPGALPGFLIGLRMATAVAWLLLVFAEQINASSGIGYLMARAQVFFQTDVIVVGLVTYAVLGLVSDAAVRLLERRLLRWRA